MMMISVQPCNFLHISTSENVGIKGNEHSKAKRARDRIHKRQMEVELARVKAENNILKGKKSEISEPISGNNKILETWTWSSYFYN